MKGLVLLRPVRSPFQEMKEIEDRIKRLFLELVFRPVARGEFREQILNAKSPPSRKIVDALSSGRLTYHKGTFSGKLNASISKELKDLGAKWDFKEQVFRIPQDELPAEVRQAIKTSESRFVEKLDAIDAKLVQVLDKKPWEAFSFTDLFDKAVFRMDKEFRDNVRRLTVQPTVTPQVARKISEGWSDNLQRSIKDFTEGEVLKLRQKVKESFFKGDRFGGLVGAIQDSYGVAERKAQFLARQETKLLTSQYQGGRYVEAGLNEYLWRAVAGTADHPTRHRHRELSRMSDKGITFRWDRPPVTTEPGEPARRNNPGEDYNCRCSAIPVARAA